MESVSITTLLRPWLLLGAPSGKRALLNETHQVSSSRNEHPPATAAFTTELPSSSRAGCKRQAQSVWLYTSCMHALGRPSAEWIDSDCSPVADSSRNPAPICCWYDGDDGEKREEPAFAAGRRCSVFTQPESSTWQALAVRSVPIISQRWKHWNLQLPQEWSASRQICTYHRRDGSIADCLA